MKNKIITITFLIMIGLMFVLFIVLPDTELSYFERRRLAKFPTEFDSTKMDDYLLDQFPFRNGFIKLNSLINRNVYSKLDTNNVYVVGEQLVDKLYPINQKEVDSFVNKMNYIWANYLQSSNVYYSIIPDKAYFLDGNKYLKADYTKLYNDLKQINGSYIDVTSVLTLEDYYKTDIHWKQENLDKIVKTLMPNMGNPYIELEYTAKTHEGFAGASYSKAGGVVPKDTITYLSNYIIDSAAVKHIEYGEKPVYDETKLTGVDAYDVFLSGPSSLIEITNVFSDTTKELVIFRDSFSSSLIPLLIPYYNKITVIDLRYITMDYVEKYVQFEGKDVLMLYSLPIINSSTMLRVTVK